MGSVVSLKQDDKRGAELKELLDQHMNNFVQKYCKIDHTAFVPINLLKHAWMQYMHYVGFNKLLGEYYDSRHNIKHGAIFFHDNLIIDNGMYFGIGLVSWPGIQGLEYSRQFTLPQKIAHFI